ncbi:MAG: NAD-dependent epimerase/dehydratase family protein [Rectinemataceae bacterium]
MSTVAVTGGTGFVGSHIVEGLLERGFGVSCLLRPGRAPGWLEGLPIRIHRGDIDSGQGLGEFLEGCDSLVHVAGLTRALTEDRFRVVNALGSAKLAAAVRNSASPPGRIIAISSLSASGPSADGRGVGADAALHPLTPYGRSKAEMERVMRSVAYPVPCTFLRPPPVYGPRDRDMLELFRMAKRGLRVSLSAKARLSFLYVENLVGAVIACIENPAAMGEDFMVADEGVYSWADFTALIGAASGRNGLAFTVPDWCLALAAGAAEMAKPLAKKPQLINRDKLLEGRQERWIADTSKTARLLGFKPAWNTADAVAATYAWYEKQGWL